jgi:hypothetical protein
MTPTEYLAELDRLMQASQFQAVLDFANQWEGQVSPPLTTAELARVLGGLDGAADGVREQRLLAADRAASAPGTLGPNPQA